MRIGIFILLATMPCLAEIQEQRPSGSPEAQQADDAKKVQAMLKPYRGFHGFPYAQAITTPPVFNTAEKRLLTNALNNPQLSKQWDYIARILALNDDSESTLNTLVSFLRRPETFQTGPRPDPTSFIAGKLNVLESIGFIQNERAVEIMRTALSREGAEKLVSNWLHSPQLPSFWRENRDRVIAYARKTAARGLVYARDEEGIAAVRELYREFAPTVTTSRLETDVPEQILLSGLLTAMITDDLIQKLGMEGFFLLKETTGYWQELEKGVKKYEIIE